MNFTCCLNMILKRALIFLCDVLQESISARTDHFAKVFVHKKVARHYDVATTLRRLKVDRLAPFLITHVGFIRTNTCQVPRKTFGHSA